MSLRQDWTKWWRRFIGIAQDDSQRVMDVLRQRYREELQQHDRLTQSAERMHYPQFRDKLLHMAAEYQNHVERLGSKIVMLGGTLPDVPGTQATNENSWQQLLTALEADDRSVDRVIEELRGLHDASPEVTGLLQEILQEQKKHRDILRAMLMRSDPFAFSLA